MTLDSGTYAANKTDPVVAERAVFIVSNSDSTTGEEVAMTSSREAAASSSAAAASAASAASAAAEEASAAEEAAAAEEEEVAAVTTEEERERQPHEYLEHDFRNVDAVFHAEKDIAAVCSLSFHLPKDAVAMGAITPLGVTPPWMTATANPWSISSAA